ncbi:MAG: aldo/keto reductase, partial [Candidatus Thorarchaeota archaeon]|nr:aldo/keto reductase [Candidatus Thorarchaeota archaeon]
EFTMAEVSPRRLGKSELEVTPIGLGAMQMSGGKGMFRYFLSAIPSDTQNEVIRVALESGINWIDTAEIYGSGASERAVSEGLVAAGISPGDVLITTKWFPLFKRAKGIQTSAEKSGSRLAPYPIDLYLVHQPMSVSSVESQMNAMADLVDNEIVRAVGVSNFSKKRMIAAYDALADRGIPLAANQMQWSLTHRNIEQDGVLETAKELGISIIAYTPLGMGILTGKLHSEPERLARMPRFRRSRLKSQLKKTKPLIDALESIASAHNATAAQVALSWNTNYHGATIVAIPGASRPIQAEQNAGAMRVRLTSEEMEYLSNLSLEIQ